MPYDEPARSCPRCGYDQRGTIDAWPLAQPPACPLDGTCPECGLTFRWADVLAPHRQSLGWFAETSPRSAWVWLPATWLRSLVPWRFWRQVTLTMPLRPGRMVIAALAAFVLTHAVFGVFGGGAAVVAHWAENSQFRAWAGNSPFEPSIAGMLASALWPLESNWPSAETTPFRFVLALMGLSALAITPWTLLLLPVTLRRARVRSGHLARLTLYSLAAAPLAVGTFALAAQLRESALHSLWRLPPSGTRALAMDALDALRFLGTPRLSLVAWVALISASFVGFGVRRYLRLPRAWLVTLVMSVLAWAIVLLVVVGPMDAGTWLMLRLDL